MHQPSKWTQSAYLGTVDWSGLTKNIGLMSIGRGAHALVRFSAGCHYCGHRKTRSPQCKTNALAAMIQSGKTILHAHLKTLADVDLLWDTCAQRWGGILGDLTRLSLASALKSA